MLTPCTSISFDHRLQNNPSKALSLEKTHSFFLQEERIRKREDYLRIKRHGSRTASEHFIFFVQKNSLTFSRMGLVVSKKVGNAVVRNRVKRLLREGFRRNKEFFLKGMDVVILAKPSAKTLSYVQIVQIFRDLRCNYHMKENGT